MSLPRLFVLSAPSGAGKTTLKDRLLEHYPELVYSISATTRPMRQGEVDGTHYFFKTREEFEAMIGRGDLVEYNLVHGNYYGTPRPAVESSLKAGKSVIFDLDVYGKKNFDVIYPDSIGILILPPSIEELEKRLRSRNSDRPEVVDLRLKNAVREMEFARTEGKYEHTLINDDLEATVKALCRIVGGAIL